MSAVRARGPEAPVIPALLYRRCWRTQTLARRIGRFLERQGLLERDAENSYLAGDVLEAGPMEQLPGTSMMCKDARMSRAQDAQERPTYRIAVGPQQGRKVFTLQTLPACEELCDAGVGKVAGLSLHAGVAARADQYWRTAIGRWTKTASPGVS